MAYSDLRMFHIKDIGDSSIFVDYNKISITINLAPNSFYSLKHIDPLLNFDLYVIKAENEDICMLFASFTHVCIFSK